MKKLLKLILKIFLFLVAVIVFMYILSATGLIKITTERSSDTSLLQDNLVELSEWTILKYEYSNVIISRTDRKLIIFGITDIRFAESIKLIEYSGYLKAGTDLSKVEITYDKTLKKLNVRVPKSEILDNVIETEKTKVEDIKGNIFSDYPIQFVFDELNEQKKIIEDEKISQGFLDNADKRVEELLISFLTAKGFENIRIEFF